LIGPLARGLCAGQSCADRHARKPERRFAAGARKAWFSPGLVRFVAELRRLAAEGRGHVQADPRRMPSSSLRQLSRKRRGMSHVKRWRRGLIARPRPVVPARNLGRRMGGRAPSFRTRRKTRGIMRGIGQGMREGSTAKAGGWPGASCRTRHPAGPGEREQRPFPVRDHTRPAGFEGPFINDLEVEGPTEASPGQGSRIWRSAAVAAGPRCPRRDSRRGAARFRGSLAGRKVPARSGRRAARLPEVTKAARMHCIA